MYDPAAECSDSEEHERRRKLRVGIGSGVTMALGASVAFASARAGILQGLSVIDLIFVRFVAAGLIMLPLLLRLGVFNLAGLTARQSLLLTAIGGAPFALLQTGGYGFAPLAHGAVIAPAVVTICSTIGAALLLDEKISRNHLIGATVIVAGLVAISWESLAQTNGQFTWVGDALFVLSSLFWSAFTLLVRYWRLPALNVAAVVTVFSALITTAGYFLLLGPSHLFSLPLGALFIQGLIQGGVQGALVLFAYIQSVTLLGVSRAVLFPAMVPAISVLIGIPIVREVPSMPQMVGLTLVTLGLTITTGLAGLVSRERRSR